LVLGAKIAGVNNTFQRFEKMAEQEPQHQELYQQAADAYEILIRYRALQGIKNQNTGKFLNLDELTKMQRLNLRNCFRPIRELQSILEIRFQTNLFR